MCLKVVTYHYVRSIQNSLPHFKYLHVENFVAQLAAFSQVGNILGAQEFAWYLETGYLPENSWSLTFDDGLKEHLTVVAPLLEKAGLTAIFFVSSDPISKGATLDVHRLHYLLGEFGGKVVLEAFKGLYPEIAASLNASNAAATMMTYQNQKNDSETTALKRYFNYVSSPEFRSVALGELEDFLQANSDWKKNFYLDEDGVEQLRQRGHIVGSHAASHSRLAAMTEEQQARELYESYEALGMERVESSHRLFCYPFGGKLSYDRRTMELLRYSAFKRAFAVRANDLTAACLMHHPYELPRYDCNVFRFGKASTGGTMVEPDPDEQC